MTSTTDLPRFVVDASVAIKWQLSDEQDSDVAERLLRDFLADRVLLIAPDHIRYEVANALRTAVRTRRLTADEARAALEQFLIWHIPTVADDDLILAGFDQSTRFGCSLYDALYLALAEQSNCPLIFADPRLRNTLAGRFPLAHWLSDYQSAADG
ncbi:MAG: type II toxin-antitoxin system VapC family toxin [Thermomicrobiales bacterium]